MSGPFITDHRPQIGVAERLAPDIRCVTAPNGGPMTFTGTRSYLLGDGEVALIDPGPADPAHQMAILNALQPGETITAVFVTHSHVDHSAGVGMIDAPVYGFGAYDAARALDIPDLGSLEGGEGIDRGFMPEHILADGDTVGGNSWSLTAVHTPGHLSNHLCFASENRLFSGDHVMGWATTLISPPDGDLTAFMSSLKICLLREDETYFPGHGPVIVDPMPLVAHIRDHRLKRAEQVFEAVEKIDTLEALTRHIYSDIDAMLLPAASRNVLAHLIDLMRRGIVEMDRTDASEPRFRRV